MIGSMYKYSLVTVIKQRTKTILQHFRLNIHLNVLAVLLLQDYYSVLSVYVYEKIWLLTCVHITDL